MHFATAIVQQPFVHHPDGWMMGMHWGWWIFWLLLLLVLAWAVVRGQGSSSGEGGGAVPPGPARDPEEILKERFARGEITRDEYRERLRVLRE